MKRPSKWGISTSYPRLSVNQSIIVLAAVLLVWMPLVASSARGESASGSDSNALASSNAPSGPFALASQQPGEVATLRTRTSRTYAKDGHYVTQFFTDSVNYKDAQGTYQPIDNSLVPSAASGYAVQNKANRYSVRFPSDIGSNPVHVETSAGWVEFAPVGAAGAGTVSGNTETYALPGSTLALSANSDSMKESVTLQSASSPSKYLYSLHTSAGLTPQQNSIGGIDFLDTTGTIQFSFTPPFMTDNAGSSSHAVTLTLLGSGAATTVTLAVDPSWLADPARSYPVVIDPTVNVGAPTQYGCISSTSSVNCSTRTVKVAHDANGSARSLVQFDVSSIPSQSQILDADFNMNLTSATYTGTVPIAVYPVTQSWIQTGDSMNATWMTYDGLNSWATPGGDFASTPTFTANVSSVNNGHTIHWNIAQLVQGWISGSMTNNGMIIKEQSETTNDSLTFLPSTVVLTVTYTPWLGQQNFTSTLGNALNEHMSYAVNTTTGNLMFHEADISMPGIGLPLTVGRTYNNLASNTSDFGDKWLMDSGRDIGLQVFTDGSAAFVGPSGFQVPFIKNADGTVTAPPGLDADLTQNQQTGFYTITFHASGIKYNFNSVNYLSSIQDRSGNSLNFTYTGSNLTSITDTQGRTTSFAYNNTGWITQVIDPAGRTYKYAYDTWGDLTSYTAPNNTITTLAYTAANGDLAKVTDPMNNVTNFTYDAQHRVTAVTRVSTACPNNACRTSYSYGAGTSTTTDANNHTSSYTYDSYGRMTAITSSLGHTWHRQWNLDHHITQHTTPMSENTNYAYDSNNNPTGTTIPTGATWSALYKNTATPYNPSSTTDAEGNKTTYTYDSAGRLLTSTDALNQTTSITYNSNGTVATRIDANNHVTTYSYFSASNNPCPTAETAQNVGLLCEVQSPLGATMYTYNSYNLVASESDPKGQTTSYTYGLMGHVRSETLADGMVTSFSSDPNGNLSSQIDSSQQVANGGLEDMTAWQSSSSTSDPVLGDTAHPNTGSRDALLCGVNSCNDQLWQTVTLPTLFTKAYLSFWVRIDTQEATGAPRNDSLAVQVQTSAGTVISTPLTLGNDTVTNGYVLEKLDVTSALTTYAGQQVRVAFVGTTNGTLPTNFTIDDVALYTTGTRTTSNTYDEMNRLTQKTWPDGSTTSYTYDPGDNLTAKTDIFNGTTYTVGYAYNADNQLTSVTSPLGVNDVTTFTYDNDGRRKTTTFPGGTVETMNYNSSGQLTSIGAARQGTTLTNFTYSYYNPDKYLYQGLRFSMTDTSGTVNHYCYDGANRLTTVYQTSTIFKCATTTVTPSYSYVYDPVGNMTSKAINGGPPTTMSYNAADELTSVGGSIYHYDANGNEISNGSSSFAYNAADETNAVTPLGSASSGMTYAGGGQTERLTNGPNSYNYDDSGLVLSSDGTTTTYVTRTPDGQLISEQIGSTSYYYLVDGLGSVSKLVDSLGAPQDSYTYDPYGGTTIMQQSVANSLRYIGGVYDNGTGLYKLGARYYDPSAGRFTQRDPLGCPAGESAFAYSHGDPITFTDPSGLSPSGAAWGRPSLCDLCEYIMISFLWIKGPLSGALNCVSMFVAYVHGHPTTNAAAQYLCGEFAKWARKKHSDFLTAETVTELAEGFCKSWGFCRGGTDSDGK